MISISLEVVTDKNYAELRSRFLKDAGRFYDKEAWKMLRSDWQAYFGMGFGAAGVAGLYLADHYHSAVGCLAAIAFAGGGIMNMCWAAINKRRIRKRLMERLEKDTESMGPDELDKRIQSKDYDISEPTQEQRQTALMDVYSVRVVNSVIGKDYGMVSNPLMIGGLGVMAGGFYMSQTGSPVAGGAVMAAGGVVAMGSQLNKFLRIRKIAKKVRSFIHEKGYDFFETYAMKKDPYDFYKRFIETRSAC